MVKNLSTIDRSTKVRLGRHATDDQADNTIVINASNAPISARTPGSLYMTPLREAPGGNTKILGYDPATKEIVNTNIDEPNIVARVVDFYANIGNVFTSTIQFTGPNSLITTGNVGISNSTPVHTLDVGSNLWVDDTGSVVLGVTGGVEIQGNLDVKGQLTVIESQNLRISDAIIEVGKGNTTADVGIMLDHQGSNVVVGYKDDELIFAHTQSSADHTSFTANTANPITAHVYGYLVTQSNVGVINTNPVHTLDVGSNLWVNDTTANVLYVRGTTDLDGHLVVMDNVYVSNNLIVTDNVYATKDLTVTEDAYVIQDLTVTENVYVSNNLNVTKDLTVTEDAYVIQDLTVTENVYVSNNLVVTKDLTVKEDAYVIQDLTVTENVYVSNNLNVTKDLTVKEDAYVIQDLTVTENVYVSNNLNVTKDLTVTEDAYVIQDLTVTENVYVSNNLVVTKDLTVKEDAYVIQDLTVTENVYVSNNLTVTKDLTVNNDVRVLKDLTVTENVYVSNNLTVTEDAYVIQDLTVTENVYVSNNLNVTKDLTVTENAYVIQDLTVTENAYMSNNLTVTKDIVTRDVKVTTLSPGRVPYVNANKYLVDSPNFTYDNDTNKLTVAGDIVATGNMFIQGETTYVETQNLVVDDPIIELANNNVSGGIDMGIIMNRPGSNVAIGYRDPESEFIIAHTLSDASGANIDPDTSNLIDVHVYGRMITESNIGIANTNPVHLLSVGSNIYMEEGLIDVTGNIYATTYHGDGGVLSNLTLQVVTDHGNTTSNTIQFTNPTMAFTTDLTSNVDLKLDQLNSVTIDGLTEDQLLVYDGNKWVNEYNLHNFIRVRNRSGIDMYRGNVVYITGSFNSNTANVALAKANSTTTMPAIGVLHEDLAVGATGMAVAYGKVQNVSTIGFTNGQTIYVSNVVAGGFMNSKPYGLGDQIQNVGVCIQGGVANGTIFVTGVGRSNDIPNAPIETVTSPYVYVNTANNNLRKIAPTNLLTKLQTLEQVTATSNITSKTIEFQNTGTSLKTSGDIDVGKNAIIRGITAGHFPVVDSNQYLRASTISLANGSTVIASDVEITGNITVTGNSYIVEAENLVVSDRVFGIANNNVSHTLDVGFIMQHPGKNVGLIHHGEDGNDHEHEFTIGYTQNTVTDNSILDDTSNLITVNVIGHLKTQNNMTVGSGGAYYGDGGLLSNVDLQVVTDHGNSTTNTVIFNNTTAALVTNALSNTGIANLNPIHMLDVGANIYMDATSMNVTGNVVATRFIGDGSYLDNIASTLEDIIVNGNTTSNTVIFNNTTAAFVTNTYSNTGIANLNPVHMLDVGDNIYMDATSINVTGNVVATRFIGDGSYLDNIASTLEDIIINGNTTSNTVIFDNTMAAFVTNAYSNTGIANLNPIHMLDVGSKIYMEEGVINVDGNVVATRFIGDGSYLDNIASTLEDIIVNGNTTSNTVIFNNTVAAFVTNAYSNTGIANLNPIHMLDVGSNIYMDSTSVNVTGNVVATRFIGDGSYLDNIASTFEDIIMNGNVASNTVIFNNTTAAFVTNAYSNTGIANLNPTHMLDVGTNIYMDATSINVTGNVVATRFIGDGSYLDNIASTFEDIIMNGNVTSNTVIFNNTTTAFVTNVYSNTGIANVNPIHTLDIGSNVWFTDTEAYKLSINGNAIMKNITLDSITLGTVFPLQAVTRTGNVTSNTIEFTNETTGFVTTSNVGIANVNVIHTLDVGSNLYVEDTGSNVLVVRGNIYSDMMMTETMDVTHTLTIGSNVTINDTASNVLAITGNVLANKLTLGSIEILPSYRLDDVIEVGNTATSVVEFNGPTTSLVAASNVGIGTTSPRTLLEVYGGVITNSDGYACKRYSYSNASVTANFSNVAFTFVSNVFCAKITAQLTHGNEEVSTLIFNVQGGTRDGTESSLNIAPSATTLFGHTNSKPWNSAVSVTPTKVILEPSITGTTAYGCDLFVEYLSSAPDGKLESISIGDDTVKSFVY
jgi:UDP-3-O-[3-hydroxymyristoyl] glucosamine N-acyltransferase/predicted acylesterase/phospholipase RssA